MSLTTRLRNFVRTLEICAGRMVGSAHPTYIRIWRRVGRGFAIVLLIQSLDPALQTILRRDFQWMRNPVLWGTCHCMCNTNPRNTLHFSPNDENLKPTTDADIGRSHASRDCNGCNRDEFGNPLHPGEYVPKIYVATHCSLDVFGGNWICPVPVVTRLTMIL